MPVRVCVYYCGWCRAQTGHTRFEDSARTGVRHAYSVSVNVQPFLGSPRYLVCPATPSSCVSCRGTPRYLVDTEGSAGSLKPQVDSSCGRRQHLCIHTDTSLTHTHAPPDFYHNFTTKSEGISKEIFTLARLRHYGARATLSRALWCLLDL